MHQAPELILGAARCGEVLDDVRHREPVGRDGREVLALGTVIVVDGRPHGALGRGRGDGHLPDVRKQVEVVLRGDRREVHGEGGDVRTVLLLHERPVPEEVVVHVGDLSEGARRMVAPGRGPVSSLRVEGLAAEGQFLPEALLLCGMPCGLLRAAGEGCGERRRGDDGK